MRLIIVVMPNIQPKQKIGQINMDFIKYAEIYTH